MWLPWQPAPGGYLGYDSCSTEETAETYLGGEVNDAVVKVPAYFMIPSISPPRMREQLQGLT